MVDSLPKQNSSAQALRPGRMDLSDFPELKEHLEIMPLDMEMGDPYSGLDLFKTWFRAFNELAEDEHQKSWRPKQAAKFAAAQAAGPAAAERGEAFLQFMRMLLKGETTPQPGQVAQIEACLAQLRHKLMLRGMKVEVERNAVLAGLEAAGQLKKETEMLKAAAKRQYRNAVLASEMEV